MSRYNTKRNPWNAVEHLKPGNIVNPGDANLDLINQTIADLSNQINSKVSFTTRDIVFKMGEPLENGIQFDTEFLYPYDGIIEELNVSVNTESKYTSNLSLALQIMKGSNWFNVETISLQRHELHKIIPMNYTVVKNNRFRVSLIDGNFPDISGIDIVLLVKNT